MTKKLISEKEEREQKLREINEKVKQEVEAEQAEVKAYSESLEKETEAEKKQKQFAQALKFLTDEKWKEIQETTIEPIQAKIDEAHEKLNAWRDQHNNFVTYVYKEYTKALLDAVKKELKKWKKESFTVKVEELERENQAISTILHEMDSIFESMIIEFAEALGKQQNKSKKQKKRK